MKASTRLINRHGWLVPCPPRSALLAWENNTISPAFVQRYGGEVETCRLFGLCLESSDGIWLAGHEAKPLFLCGVALVPGNPTIGQCWVFPFDSVHQHPITTLLAARTALALQAKLGLREVFSYVPVSDTRSMRFAVRVGFDLCHDQFDLPIGNSLRISWSSGKEGTSKNDG